MTATRDRRSDPAEDADMAWDDRPILGTFRGLPWWGAVLLAFGLAAVAAVVEMQVQGSLGKIYQGAYLLGCVAAICLVRRRSLFGPMVQPPLVFAVTAIGAVIIFGEDGGSGLKQLIFSVALPLTSNFPTMAITTALTVALGLYRLWKQRDPNPPVRATRPAADTSPPASPQKKRPTNRPTPPEDESSPRRGNRPARDRNQGPRDRARSRDQDQPRRRDTETPRPRRDQPDRDGPSSRPRRRPPDQRR
ncbi:DUF6542 domain-containing protein [Actinophytocola xanthii]|uniref:DUF6542 domain-containing protein n=1 Tax=Actinophytocola xanthii TaxID=1912961 RepID=A0A1Q8CML9_9PSEU|nr:DUF6542 domain-containing protein [Actinophytocola xanthii]OLF15585.1 hypothetical protein BU204_20935 [Actinophytocola xanthii]